MNRKNYMEKVHKNFPLSKTESYWADDYWYQTFFAGDQHIRRRNVNNIKRKHGIPQRYALMMIVDQEGKVRYQRFVRKYQGTRIYMAKAYENREWVYPKY